VAEPRERAEGGIGTPPPVVLSVALLLDFHADLLHFRFLRQRNLAHAVSVVRLDFLSINGRRQLEAPLELAVTSLDAVIVFLLDFLFLPLSA
jgi:hypothetical protein